MTTTTEITRDGAILGPVTELELAHFCALLTERAAGYYARHYTNLTPPTFHADPNGKRYVRIVERQANLPGGSAVVFIERANGTIWYPAGYKGPALKSPARGNLRDANPLKWFSDRGACMTCR
jgi:hypothetical protein